MSMLETPIQKKVSETAAYQGITLWRNNVGSLPDANGRPVRYGLCNDSKQLNKVVKSSDLIGITPVFITPDMIGQILGVFTALETKKEDWTFNPNDPRQAAQAKYHDIVRANGGFAGFINDPAMLSSIIRRG